DSRKMPGVGRVHYKRGSMKQSAGKQYRPGYTVQLFPVSEKIDQVSYRPAQVAKRCDYQEKRFHRFSQTAFISVSGITGRQASSVFAKASFWRPCLRQSGMGSPASLVNISRACLSATPLDLKHCLNSPSNRTKKSHSEPISSCSFCLSSFAAAGLRPEVDMAMLKAPCSKTEGTIKDPSSGSVAMLHQTPSSPASAAMARFKSGSSVAANARLTPCRCDLSYRSPAQITNFSERFSSSHAESSRATSRILAPYLSSVLTLRSPTAPAPTTRQVRPSMARKRG